MHLQKSCMALLYQGPYILPLGGLANPKRDPISHGHGALYLSRLLPASRGPTAGLTCAHSACCWVQVEEVAQFVSDNARRVLGVDAAKVLPVSARAALQAKLDATYSRNGFFGEASALHRSVLLVPCRDT